MRFERKPLVELERECNHARTRGLIKDLIYCPLERNPYIVLKFCDETHDDLMKKIFTYVQKNYDVDTIELSMKEKTLYISYDFWKRFPSE